MPESKGRVVIAVGGNALIIDKTKESIPDQYKAVVSTSKHIIDMVEAGWQVVVTHGNGPQVGFVLRRSEISMPEIPPVPMDYAGADIQGAVGYMFLKALHNEMHHRGMEKPVAAIITQTLIDREDPAFRNPTKPIGSYLDETSAKNRQSELGWSVAEDAGRGWRRVVPSPYPKEIIELDLIRLLVDAGNIVICGGGGGIPVIRDKQGKLQGTEAVIDKDLASGLLAVGLEAQIFIISTAVEKVAVNFNKPNQKWLEKVTLPMARRLLDEGHFLKGSMEPKVKAMIAYLEAAGPRGIVTDPPNLPRALRGETGTCFVQESSQ